MISMIALSPLRGGPTGRHDKKDEIVGARFASCYAKYLSSVAVFNRLFLPSKLAKRVLETLSYLSCRPVGSPTQWGQGDHAYHVPCQVHTLQIAIEEF
jgi:hypothetical protein